MAIQGRFSSSDSVKDPTNAGTQSIKVSLDVAFWHPTFWLPATRVCSILMFMLAVGILHSGFQKPRFVVALVCLLNPALWLPETRVCRILMFMFMLPFGPLQVALNMLHVKLLLNRPPYGRQELPDPQDRA